MYYCIRCDADQVCAPCSGSYDALNGTCVQGQYQTQDNQNANHIQNSLKNSAPSTGIATSTIMSIVSLSLIGLGVVDGIISIVMNFLSKGKIPKPNL